MPHALPLPAALLALGLAACAADAPAPPARWLGLADVEGRILLPAGATAADAEVAWANLDRRRPDREPERGTASRIEPDGRFTIEELPWGTYQVSLTWKGGTPVFARLVVDEALEQLELAAPTGAVVVPPPAGAGLREVSLRPFGDAESCGRVDVGRGDGARFDGLLPGHYLVTSTSVDNRRGMAVASVADGAVVVEHVPDGHGDLQLTLHGELPAGERRLVINGYARAPGGEAFDFGRPAFSRPARTGFVEAHVPAGAWALLLLAKDDAGEEGDAVLAWLPDVAVPEDGRVHLDVEIPPLRAVHLRPRLPGLGPSEVFTLRVGDDLLPGALLVQGLDAGGRRLLLPARDCAVIGGRARPRLAEGGTPVEPGEAPLELLLPSPRG